MSTNRLSFLHNFRIYNINALLRSECVLLSKYTNPEDTVFKKWKEIILSILKYSSGMMRFPKTEGLCPMVKKPSSLLDTLVGVLEGTYCSELQYKWKRKGFPMIATKCIRQGLGDRNEI